MKFPLEGKDSLQETKTELAILVFIMRIRFSFRNIYMYVTMCEIIEFSTIINHAINYRIEKKKKSYV